MYQVQLLNPACTISIMTVAMLLKITSTIWCILTDELSYTIDEELNGNYYFESDDKPDYFNTCLFNAGNSNIPWKPIFQKQGKHGKHSKHAEPNSQMKTHVTRLNLTKNYLSMIGT